MHAHDHHHDGPALSLTIHSPSGILLQGAALTRALRHLRHLGFDAHLDESARARQQRFAGDDETRLAALHRVARDGRDIALASRGGYGLTRLLDAIDYRLIARSIDAGKRWVGHSDQTAFQLAVLAHTGRGTWAGPLAHDDFSRTPEQGGVDDVTEACFTEAMHGELEAVGFRTETGFDGLEVRGPLWGGNLCMLLSLLGTPHWPAVKGGILFLEDVNEHPYRIERGLLQLHQAGVLDAQKAVVLGAFTDFRPSPLDRGYTLKSAIARVRAATRRPVLTGLPFGHVPTKVCLPVGRRGTLAVQGRDALIGWA
ncbi:LD-carboxypeptidase [uncultured Methylibium sp.]|uniref:LD-carboxypeptidase n=1 Tax=uncultured Methylibium sp. TaxID=381093 RepID=UPI0025D3B72D|nr:LD-carboxypeptidase [uncultured Methylibium sp.]